MSYTYHNPVYDDIKRYLRICVTYLVIAFTGYAMFSFEIAIFLRAFGAFAAFLCGIIGIGWGLAAFVAWLGIYFIWPLNVQIFWVGFFLLAVFLFLRVCLPPDVYDADYIKNHPQYYHKGPSVPGAGTVTKRNDK